MLVASRECFNQMVGKEVYVLPIFVQKYQKYAKRIIRYMKLCSLKPEDTELTTTGNKISIILFFQDEKNQVLTTFGWLEVVSVHCLSLHT